MSKARAAAVDLEAFAAEDAGKDELRRALGRAQRSLAVAKASKEDLVKAVFDGARDAMLAVDMPPVREPKADKRPKTPEVAICPLADWQLAKRTRSYNSEVCARRISEYADKIERLTAIQRAAHPVRECRIYLLGDLVEGEQIYPGQAHLIDSSLFAQVLTAGPSILGDFVRRMAGLFESVHVAGVIGNHGAIGGPTRRESHPETNADAMMYEVTRLLIEKDSSLRGRVTWAPNVEPGERKWYAVDRVGDKGFFLFHGDQVKGGFAGFPWYGFTKKVMGWRMGAVPEPFDYALSGHFHTPTRMLIGDVTLWASGSPESDNTYAAERLAAQGTPSQNALFTHPKRGVTAEYQVHLS